MMNAYATDAILCSSGQRHQPKFDHFQKLHSAIADIASILLESPSALFHNRTVEVLSPDGSWEIGKEQTMFVYRASSGERREVVFVENNMDIDATVRVPVAAADTERVVLDMTSKSAILIVDGVVTFDSASIDVSAMSFTRKYTQEPVSLDGWMYWNEPIGVMTNGSAISADLPVEQTLLSASQNISSDYAWYETSFELVQNLRKAAFRIETQKGNGMIVFVDGVYVGAADNHDHSEGAITLSIACDTPLTKGNHTLAILSVSLGYHNLICRWSGNTGQKTKGITGNVSMSSVQLDEDIGLVDGRRWYSQAGLGNSPRIPNDTDPGPTWSSAFFRTPLYDSRTQGLFLELTSGRGHILLNGKDLGRFWNITRGSTNDYSMQYYFFPPDYLTTRDAQGILNKIVIFNEFGGNAPKVPRLVLSWIEVAETTELPDLVDFHEACI
jgi:hypothetical protein